MDFTYPLSPRLPKDKDGSLRVREQDQTTEPMATRFLKSISNFSLLEDTGISTVDTIVRTFEASGLAEDQEILLLDTAASRSFYGKIIAEPDGTTNSFDSPIDHIFPAATTLGRVVSSELKINGSVTEQIFSVRAGAVPVDYIQLSLNMLCAGEPDFSKFGDQGPLTRGVCLRIVNGFQKTMLNFKTLGDMEAAGGHVHIQQKSGGGSWGVTVHLNLKEIFGVVSRIEEDSVLQIVIQDNITITSLNATVTGQAIEE